MADSRKRSSRMVGRKIELPSEGVHTEDGFLFHHVGTVNLKSEEIERLYECGLFLSTVSVVKLSNICWQIIQELTTTKGNVLLQKKMI